MSNQGCLLPLYPLYPRDTGGGGELPGHSCEEETRRPPDPSQQTNYLIICDDATIGRQ